MWLESSTVRPRRRSSATHCAEDLLHQRVQARGRLVEDQQLDVGRQRGDQRDLLAVALGVGAALLGRVELEALEQLRPARLVQPAAQARRAGRSPRRRSGSATASRRRGRRRAGGAGRSRRATGSPSSRRAAPPSARNSPSRTRIVVDLPAPLGPRKPWTSPSATSRSSPSSARVRPEGLDEAGDGDRGHASEDTRKRESSEACKVREVTDDAARFIERFASVLVESGVPRMPARVFAALLADDSGRLTGVRAGRAAAGQPGGGVRRGALPDAGRA